MPGTGYDLPNTLGFPSPRVLTEAIRKWQPEPGMFIGGDMFPVEDHPVQAVEWDEYGPINGLASAHASGNKAKVVKHPIRKHHVERSLYFKEAMELTEEDVENIRQAGTYNQLAGEEEAMRMVETLGLRQEARLEHLRWSMMAGSVALDENGVKRTITYTLGSTPTAGQLWSLTSKADPIRDMQTWAKTFRGKTNGPLKVFYNRTIGEYLSQNERVRELIKRTSSVAELGPANVGNMLAPLVGGIESMTMYDEGYTTEGGVYTPFIAENKIFMVGRPVRGQRLGAFKTTPSAHNGGLKPRPGKFVITKDDLEKGDPPVFKVISGIKGVPILQHPDAILYATVA